MKYILTALLLAGVAAATWAMWRACSHIAEGVLRPSIRHDTFWAACWRFNYRVRKLKRAIIKSLTDIRPTPAGKPNPNCPICEGRGWYYGCATYPFLTNNTFRVECDCRNDEEEKKWTRENANVV